ncbi:plant expansin [Suillus lakei]|nr:plant expansin [Suillus lakei]
MFNMISTFATLFLSLTATSPVSALVVPRATAPKGWATTALESYDTYHCRYLALQCQNQHNTQFFSDCCHPLAANQSVSSLPTECQMPSGVTCSSGQPVLVVSTSGSDDGCDEPSSTPTASTPTSSTSSTTVKATPAPTTSSSAPVNVAPAPTTTHTSTHTSSASKVASTTTPSSGSSDSSLNYGGLTATQGACGTVHSDSDFICAMDQTRYGELWQCVQITNLNNGKTVVVTIADDCPTCANENSIDLSVSAFEALSDLSVGDLPIAWKFI